jgi:hypothetical protein
MAAEGMPGLRTQPRMAGMPCAMPRERRLIVVLIVAFDLSKLTDSELTISDLAAFLERLRAVRASGTGPRKVVVDVPAEEERKAS